MNPKAIKVVVIALVAALLCGAGVWIYFSVSQGPVIGSITFGEHYYMTDVRPAAFGDDVSINGGSYFLINEDKKTGTIFFNETAPISIQFIVTNYTEGLTDTKFEIEYIHQNQLMTLSAVSTADKIIFKATKDYRVTITREAEVSEEFSTISYNSTILIFKRGEE